VDSFLVAYEVTKIAFFIAFGIFIVLYAKAMSESDDS